MSDEKGGIWLYDFVESEYPMIWNKCFEIRDIFIQNEKLYNEIRERAIQSRKEVCNAIKDTPEKSWEEITALSVLPQKSIPFKEFVDLGLLSIDKEGDAIILDGMDLLLKMLENLDINFETPKIGFVGAIRYLPAGGLILVFDIVSA